MTHDRRLAPPRSAVRAATRGRTHGRSDRPEELIPVTIPELEHIAKQARQLIVETVIHAGVGHAGGSLSAVEVMTALYFDVMRIDPDNPKWEDRDRFVLSKGHGAVGLYTHLHLRGLMSRDTLFTFRANGSSLAGHPDMHKVPFVEMSTGSLGHGLAAGIGMALAAKLDGKSYRTFVMIGDGESQEGSIWEGALCAPHYKLDNLTVILDRNRIQIDGFTEDIMSLEPVAAKWRAFGWEVREIDGHSMADVVSTLRAVPLAPGKPSFIVSNTVKGKGVSFMENNYVWHGGAPNGELAEIARRELAAALEGK
ncbi:MAG: transketolase [Acidobacteriota bacterium]